jgi:hypothetical protein
MSPIASRNLALLVDSLRISSSRVIHAELHDLGNTFVWRNWMNCARVEVLNCFSLRVWSIAGLLTLTSLVGCAGGDPATAKVSGTVMMNGKPVPGGEVILAPIAGGKTSVSSVDFDGTFTCTTYKDGDGAVVGKHSVNFSPPAEEVQQAPPGGHIAARPSPYVGMVPKEQQIEVKPGEENVLNIELVKGVRAAPGAAASK